MRRINPDSMAAQQAAIASARLFAVESALQVIIARLPDQAQSHQTAQQNLRDLLSPVASEEFQQLALSHLAKLFEP